MTEQTMEKYQEVVAIASSYYRKNVSWVAFFREVLGIEGLIRKVFQDKQERAAFLKSDEYAEIQGMLEQLRARSDEPSEQEEPIRVITVRLPQSVHEALRSEASDHKTSMNKLCIAKLLHIIQDELATAAGEA